MSLLDKIQETYSSFVTYPDLVRRLMAIGIQSYTVDVATGITLFRTVDGEQAIKEGGNQLLIVDVAFNKEQVIRALRENQAGNSDFKTFINSIAAAGVRFYEANFAGENKSVTYVGIGESYEERIPL